MARILRDHAKRMSQFSSQRTVVYRPVGSLEEPTVAYNTLPSTPSNVRGPYDASKRRNPRRGRI